MISWAFSKLRYSHEGLLDAVAGELSLRAKDFGAGELTGVLYAFARLGRTLPGSTLLLCGDALVPMVGTLAPQEVSIALWSMAKMNHLNVPLFSTALSDIASR